jgi:hypothetical protein
MASSRYFQEQELDNIGGSWLERVADDAAAGYARTFQIGDPPHP